MDFYVRIIINPKRITILSERRDHVKEKFVSLSLFSLFPFPLGLVSFTSVLFKFVLFILSIVVVPAVLVHPFSFSLIALSCHCFTTN